MTTLSRQDVEQGLAEITEQFLRESGESYKRGIKMDASLQGDFNIDSMGRAELLQRVEKKWQVTLPDRLLAQAETLGDIADYLASAEEKAPLKMNHDVIHDHGEMVSLDLSDADTLIDVLRIYAEKTPEKVHVYFQHEDGSEEPITYGDLYHKALCAAEGLRLLGLMEGETVAIMQPTHPNFFYVFFGVLLAGGIPVPIYPPFRTHMLETYAKTEKHILYNAKVRILITFDQAEKLSQLLKGFVPGLKHVATAASLLQSDELKTQFKAKARHPAFIQYTSGSTANPKGVLLNHANLLTNIRAYGKAINVVPTDVAVSWLPLYHDMGLIGLWLGSLCFGIPLVLLTPFAFLNHPERWLWAIHKHRGTLSGAPNFAYELCVRKVDPARLEGLDLSCWRIAANGAEKIYPKTLADFATKFAPYGFKKSALFPVYGLAESTVALALPPLDREFLVDVVARKPFESERRAIPAESNDTDTLSFVACGRAMENHQIRIVDDNGDTLADRTVGNLQFNGPSSMQGYYDNPVATQAIYHDGWWDSGDLAYQVDGEVYLTGRRKDLIIKSGRNLYPAEIEELVGTVKGVRQGCVAAFAVNDEKRHSEQLIVVAESRETTTAQREKIIADIKNAITATLDVVPDHVEIVAPHVVPKTSSGKLQRAACKNLYLKNKLHHSQTPAWIQIGKLFAQSIFHKGLNALKYLGKVLYTTYMVTLFLLTFFPLFFLIKYSKRETGAKAIKLYCKIYLLLGGCRLHMVNAENATRYNKVIYAPNHCSYIDSMVMVALLPSNTRFVVKKELFSVPLFRTILEKQGHLGVDRLDLTKGLEDTKRIRETLHAGHPILIFPEGTFSYAPGLRPFRLGAFKIATEAQMPICPIAINGTRYILRDDERLMRPHAVEVTACDIVQPTGGDWLHVTQMRDAVRTEILKYCGEPSLDFIVSSPVAPSRIN